MAHRDAFPAEMEAEFSDSLDSRPLLLQEPLITQRAGGLCVVVHKTAFRLRCPHTLCTPCHAKCVNGEGVCPVHQEPFCEDVEKLETTVDDILRRELASWNTPRGSSFVGTAASLDHYKGREFNIMPCRVWHSSALRCNTLEHFQSGCNAHVDMCEPDINPATQELADISRACLQMEGAMGKISLETSLSRCSEDARAESARSKGHWGAQASRLHELNVLQASMADCEQHISNELGLQGEELLPRHRKVHWYVEGWADLKKRESESEHVSLDSPTRVIHDYSVNQRIRLELVENDLHVGIFMIINPGDKDSDLEWPFRKVYTLGVIHPQDQLNVISHKVDADQHKDKPSLQRPKGKCNAGLGTYSLATVDKLEEDGFVENDSLHLFLEIEP